MSITVFACIEDPGDRAAVSSCCEGVLVVISSEAKGKGAEIELTREDARAAATAIRAVVDGPRDQAPQSLGGLFVAEGAEDGTVYLSDDPTGEAPFAVLLTDEDAAGLASALNVAAADSEMCALRESLNATPSGPLTPEAMTRAHALAAAAQALGPRRGNVVVAAAHFVLTGRVVA